MAMWVHIMRLVPEAGISAGDLVERSQLSRKSTQNLVKRLGQWWGYLDVITDPADGRAKPPASEWLVHPTEAGRMAQTIWSPLADEVEERWNNRFGPSELGDLRASLSDVLAGLDVDPPDYLPVGEPRLPRRRPSRGDPRLSLSALLAKVLLALSLDFDEYSDLSLGIYTSTVGSRLPICANVLRLIGDDGSAVAAIPEHSGVARMTVDNWIGSLAKHGYLKTDTESGGRRRRMARLTTKGAHARDSYLQWTHSLEGRWPGAQSSAALGRLRRAAQHIVGHPGPGSLLWKGIAPYPDGWRNQVPPRQVLPHFPVVTAKGGFPDGS